MYKYVAFFIGLALMAFELVAARLLAPTIGNSTFIWTNVIGVIMAALAVGYWWGGKIADSRHREADIVRMCFLIAVLVMTVLMSHKAVIDLVLTMSTDARWQGLFAATLLFAPTSLVMGMVSPYLTKLALKDMDETGETVARLSAWNAIGSIVGTFVTGFLLFGWIGSRATMVVVIVIILTASWLIRPNKKMVTRIVFSICVLLVAILASSIPSRNGTVTIDTAVGNYRIVQGQQDGRRITSLLSGPRGAQSAMFNEGDKDLVFWYTQEIASTVRMIYKDDIPKRILVIGGGAFTLPEYLGLTYSDARVDVVEIDTKLEKIAREYFRFEKPENVTVFTEDARSFVNRMFNAKEETYDVIVVDVFSDVNVPWQFVTYEFGQKMANLLSENGIIVVNSISSTSAACSGIYEAQVATYSNELPFVYVKSQNKGQKQTNRELVFARSELGLLEYEPAETQGLRAYTDDFAPIDHLLQRCLSGV